MNIASIARALLNICRDLIFFIFYVRTIGANWDLNWKRVLLAVTALCCAGSAVLFGNSLERLGTVVFLLEGASEFFVSMLRLLIQLTCYYIYIRALKHISKLTAFYDALLICTLCRVVHNFFLTPLTGPIFNADITWSANPAINSLLSLLIVNGFTALIYYVVWRIIPLREVKNVSRSRMVLLAATTLGTLYINSSLKIVKELSTEYAVRFSICMIILQLMLLLYLVYFERFHSATRERLRAELENRASRSLLDSIEKQNENDKMIRHIRHDLRNHLISLRYLINNEKSKDALEYIDSLYNEYVSYQPSIKTGNLVLDGILIQKMNMAEKMQIAFSVSSNFSYLDPMNSSDMCILFGNLLDNALDACKNVEQPERFISIRGNHIGESILYTIENSCQGNLEFENGLPRTTKVDKQNHGIGLMSAKRIVKKHSGMIAFSEKDGRFSVICSFPLPLKSIINAE